MSVVATTKVSENHLKQTTNTVLMVRPVHFEFNAQTALDNEFQIQKIGQMVHSTANSEFSKAVEILRQEGINVLVLEGENEDEENQGLIRLPDAVFPNNWFGTNQDGKIIVYTMATENRRAETRRLSDVTRLLSENGYEFDTQIVVMQQELNNIAQSQSFSQDVLEGTGALVIDHIQGIAYAAKSVRCHPFAMNRMIKSPHFTIKKSIMFETLSSTGKEFYHTNVMLSIGTQFAVVCTESIVEKVSGEYESQSGDGSGQSENESESGGVVFYGRAQVLQSLKNSGRTVIEVSLEQAEKYFCANILEVRGENEEARIVMSESAFRGFTEEQRQVLGQFGKLVAVPIGEAIEPVGGGSSRCMLAEVFLPRRTPQE